MDLPFKVTVKSTQKNAVLKFCPTLEEATSNIDTVEEIKEQNEFSILFSTEETDCYLCIPELDDYDILNRNKNENNEYYFLPNSTEYHIFKRNIQSVPLIPGIYQIVVKLQSKNFYSCFKIIPKDLSIPEWEMLKEDLENKIYGLAVDFKKRKAKNNIQDKTSAQYNGNIWNKIDILLTDITMAKTSLESIKKTAKFSIQKNYSWEPVSIVKTIDLQTIKHYQSHPEKVGLLYSPKRQPDYNTKENKYLKYIINHLINFCKKACIFLDDILIELHNQYVSDTKFIQNKLESEKIFLERDYTSKINEINIQIKALNQFRAYMINFLDQEWIKGVEPQFQKIVPKSIILNPKYNNLYKMYLKNIKEQEGLTFVTEYQYYWKRTDLLYEMWTYTFIVDLLIDEGFIPISGWIFDAKLEKLPFLHDGTTIILEKDNQKLNIIFNKKMPSGLAINSIEEPIKTVSSRNKPDIRIDIFLSDKYTGSIILDAKYKKLANIIINSEDNRQIEQLQDYRNSTLSTISFEIPEYLKKQIKVTQSVFVLYPSEEGNVPSLKHYAEQNIQFYQIKPNFGYQEFSKSLLTEIDERIKIFTHHGYSKG